MNRTILIVICDFLLVSLVAFSTIDINKVGQGDKARSMPTIMDKPTKSADPGQDLAAAMRVALDEERRNRDLLTTELTRTKEEVTQQQARIGDRERQLQTVRTELQTREQQARQLQQDLEQRQAEAQRLQENLQAKEQQASRLQQEVQARDQETARLQKEQASLQQQFAMSQTNLVTLSKQLGASAADAQVSRERVQSMEADMRRQTEQAAALQSQLQALARSNQAVLDEKQRLAAQLQVAEVEKRHATEQVGKMEQQLQGERTEKARLVEGVKTLAEKSTALEQEIRENRPLAPNTIFNEFVANRVQARLTAVKPGMLGGDSVKNKNTDTVLVTDGTNTFAVCHIDDTPIVLWNPGTDWLGITGTLLGRNTTAVPLRQFAFHINEPRVIYLPLSPDEVKQVGSKPYKLANDPFKFQDAVLIGPRDSYYGECKFQIDTTTPDYVQLDRSVLKGLFGKFNPSRGDLVFSKNGELLGIMANNTYAFKLNKFSAAATFQLGPDVRSQNTGYILTLLHSRLMSFPYKLQ